ncbi:MAG: glycosyltransferase family 2 protein [bacterium]
MLKNKIAIVILNWNGKKYLEKFIPTLIKYSKHPEVEIVVADNASTDVSKEFLKENYPGVHLIVLDKNYGFAEGYNRALSNINTDYYILLNSDVEVTGDWFLPVIEFMEKDEQIAVCMPKLKSYSEKEYFEYAGAAGGFIDELGFPFCRGRLFNTIEKDHGQYDQISEIFWATGACTFIKSKIFHEVGGFDKDFFAHMEEIDLCWRIKVAGYKVFYFPYSIVYHVGGGTLPQGNPFKTFLNYRNNLFLLYKNLPSKKLLPILFARLILDIISGFYSISTKKYNDLYIILKAHYHFFLSIPSLKKKRKNIQKIKKVNSVSCIYRGSIVKSYFINQIRIFSNIQNKII